MRRAERLFQIIQILRRSRGAITAAAMARELEVSKRTVYRDIADLIGQRVPIEAAAGLGYLLASGYDMPPLMLTPDETEALVLGMQWVAGLHDPALANAAANLIAKVVAVVPEAMRSYILEPSVGPKPASPAHLQTVDTSTIRRAIRDGSRLKIRYGSEQGVETERTIWPVILGYSDATRMLVAWCELREDFRHFRADRILQLERLDAYAMRPAQLRRRWEAWRAEAQRLVQGR